MVKQVSLETWQIQRLQDLLHMGSDISSKTDRTIILYRQTIDEDGGCYEETVCTLTAGFVIEQIVTSGGMLVPSFRNQVVYTIQEYPQVLLSQSKERFEDVTNHLEKQIGLLEEDDEGG